MADTITIESCEEIKNRLRDAEKIAGDLLAKSSADDDLAKATKELLNVHAEIRGVLQRSLENHSGASATTNDDLQRAEIEIEADNHELKSDPIDILKALFMWRETPEERVKEN